MPHPLARHLSVILLFVLLGTLAGSCAAGRQGGVRPARAKPGYVKDNKPAIWISDHPRIAFFRDYYRGTKTVDKALDQGRPYLPTMVRTFERRGLPVELAYLPMLESMFVNRANSGHARGLWQFTRQTAQHQGLRVGAFSDERLNWRKATEAAADYLDQLGEQFHYDWALALAAYNGGPNYLEDEMRRQGTRDYFRLRLRKETEEYVARFIAMLQVARERFPSEVASR
jgi:membrane-bound lytic murein transglycosylase D